MAATAVCWHALQHYALWHLAKVGGNETAGAFHAARLFAQLLLWGALSLSAALSSHVTRVWESSDPDDALRRLEVGTKMGLILITGCAVILSLIRPLLLRVFRLEYVVSEACFDPMLLGYAWFGVLGFLLIRFQLQEHPERSLWVSLGGTLASVALGIFVLGVVGDPAASDPDAMVVRAGWLCAGGAGASVATCLALQMFRGAGFQGRTAVMILSMAGLGVGGVYGLIVLAAMAVLALGGSALFSCQERAILWAWCRDR